MTEISNINWKQTDDGKWLAYDENNSQIIGWVHQSSDDKWFYCYSDDIAKNWFKDSDDRWYYFSPCQQVTYGHQYYVGEMMVNWVKIEDKWYYLVPNSIPSEGLYRGQTLIDTTEEIDGVNYNFSTSGEWMENNKADMKLVKFIESWEGFPNNGYKYYDCVGILTQGFGLTGEEISNLPNPITQEKAEELLINTLNNKYIPPIVNDLNKRGITLSEQQLHSLISMAYNVGYAGVLGSTLYKNVCNGVRDENTIISNFTAWSNGGGKRIEGLYKRRLSEAKMFLYGDYTGNN